jgi:hypothetical protein
MEKVIVHHAKEWLEARHLRMAGKLNPIYINETVVYEFYKFTSRKAMFTGVVIGMAISVAIAALVKLAGV